MYKNIVTIQAEGALLQFYEVKKVDQMKLYIGEQIKNLRKERELTQEQFADVLNVSYQSVSRWELGVCYPDVELLPTIANYFGVSVDQLLSNDPISKDADTRRFYDTVNTFEFASLEQLQFIEDFVRKYPDNDRFAHIMLNTMTHYVLCNKADRAVYMPQITKLFERLSDTIYREAALENMVILCDENDLDNWLNLCSWSSDCTRRGYLVSRYTYRGDEKQGHIQQGIKMFENLAVQLDSRFPDSFGAARKAEYQRAVLNVINSFGDGCTPPDGWGFYYAYKQLVLSACLFGDSKFDEGWREFDTAIAIYKKLLENKDEWLSLGNALFRGLKIRRDYTAILDTDGNEHAIFGSHYIHFCSAAFVYNFLIDSAWTWFDSVRDTDHYKEAVALFKSQSEI